MLLQKHIMEDVVRNIELIPMETLSGDTLGYYQESIDIIYEGLESINKIYSEIEQQFKEKE